jgi:hypothetical protein
MDQMIKETFCLVLGIGEGGFKGTLQIYKHSLPLRKVTQLFLSVLVGVAVSGNFLTAAKRSC